VAFPVVKRFQNLPLQKAVCLERSYFVCLPLIIRLALPQLLNPREDKHIKGTLLEFPFNFLFEIGEFLLYSAVHVSILQKLAGYAVTLLRFAD